MKKLLASLLKFHFNKTPLLWSGVLVILLGFFVGAPVSAIAEESRHYEYASVEAVYSVQKNTAVFVEETLVYDFTGEYHQGYRSLPHKGSDEIRDIAVWDATTGEKLRYSSKKLNKLDPASWGAYAVYEDNGATNVEWYYSLKDTTHSWKIAYTLYGAIGFYENHDELYWNIFTNLEAPVRFVKATISLPGVVTTPQTRWYVSGSHDETSFVINSSTFGFAASNFGSGEPATFAVGWQKGVVDERAYWWYVIQHYWAYILSAIIGIGSILLAILYWYATERYGQKSRPLIVEYDPPSALRPATAALIVNEGVTPQVWPATIVDLAVRGYLSIHEEKGNTFRVWARTFGYFFVFTIVVVGGYFLISKTWDDDELLRVLLPALFVAGAVALMGFALRKQFSSTPANAQYLLIPQAADLSTLKEYEKDFLKVLFGDDLTQSFSTTEIKKDPLKAQKIFKGLTSTEEKLFQEADSGTMPAYAPTLAKKKQGVIMAVVTVLGLFWFGAFFLSLHWYQPYLVLGFSVVFAVVITLYMFRFEARLTSEGKKLYEHLRGFKEYLQTAERYRMQNLTPELFEKYLPYAMIFGIERKWAKAFDTLSIPPPSWYHGASGAYASGTSGSFSPASFATGFSASFASSFASSGGGGASGGGGSAGGGGGGGGGGAS